MNRIIAFVAPSGGGKTTLMKALVNRLPGRFGFLPGFLTRPLREGEEDLNLRVIPVENGKGLYEKFIAGDSDEFINVSEGAGVYYGNSRKEVDEFLKSHTAIKDLYPEGIRNFRAAGYQVDVIVIEPIGHTPRPGRPEKDAEAAKEYATLEPIATVVADHRDKYGIIKSLNHLTKLLT